MSVKFKVPIEVDGQVSAEYLDLSTSTSHPVNAGEIAWNSIDGTFDIGLLNGVTLQAGQEMHFYGKATEAISNGNAVMFAGVQGDHILIAKADAATINANPEYFMGVATQDFTTNQFGYVTAFGNVRGLNTLVYTLGDVLYFDSTSATDGLLTATEPSAPNAKIIVAAVVRVHATQGILAVRPHTMPRLKDIQDVNVDTATTGEILQLQSTGVWENKTLSEAGIISGTGTTNYVSKFTGTTSLGNSLIYDDGSAVGIGTTSVSNGFLNVYRSTSGTTVRFSNPSGYVDIGPNNSGGAHIYTDRSQFYMNQRLTLINGQLSSYSPNNLSFMLNSGASTAMTILNTNGNVGIGTTSPGYKLHIVGDVYTSTGYIAAGNSYMNSIGNTSTNNNANISLTTSGVRVSRNIADSNTAFAVTQTNASSTGAIQTWNNSGGELMRVTSTGNVGIGTTSPSGKLASVANMAGWAGWFENQDATGVGSGLVVRAASNSGGFTFLLQKQDATSTFAVTGSGNVGIGTTIPSGKLDVIGNLYTSGEFRIGASYGTTGTGLIKSNSGVLSLFTWGDSTNIQIGGSDVIFKPEAGSERMRLTSAGNLGVGVSAPGYKTQIESSSSVVFLSKNTSSTSFNRSYFYNNSDVGIQIQTYGSAYPFGTLWPGGANSADITCNAANGLAIGTSTASAFVLGTNSAERMRIDSSGNILVGQTSAIYSATNRANLTIGKSAGSIIVLGTSTAANGYLFYNNTDIELANSTSSGSVFFRTSGTERMRITSSGNVGIGTTSPNFKLGIQASEPTFGILQAISNNNGGNATLGAKILFDVSGIGNFWEGMPSGANAWAVGLYNGSTNPEYMRITSSGNVGIGTTSPATKLEVSGIASFTGSGGRSVVIEGQGAGRIDINGDGSAYAVGIKFNSSPGGTALSGIWNYGSGTSQQWLAIGGTAYNNAALYTLPSGNVGIGTSSPSAKFDINDSTSIQQNFSIANDRHISIYADAYQSIINSVKNVPLVFRTFDTERMRITSAGNVGIGTTSPNEKLEVQNGTSGAKIKVSNTGGGYASLECSSNASSVAQLSFTNQLSLIGGDVSIGTTTSLLPNTGRGNLTINGTSQAILTLGVGGAWNSYFYTDGSNTQIGAGGSLILGTNGGGEKMRITSAGNVGIGTSSPNNPLEVNGVISSKGLGPYSLGGTFGFGGSQTSITGDALLAYVAINTGGSGEKMRVDINGNVGIGTSLPSAKLDVNGDALINGLTVGRGGGNSAYNTALGVGALAGNTSGEYNIAIGRSANSAVDISGATVIGTDLFTSPGNNSLTSNCLAISQHNPSNSGTQYPHIYAPDKVNCPNGNTTTDVIAVDYSIYTAIFMEYSIFNSAGDQFRAGTYTVAFKSTGTPVDNDNQTVVYSLTTLLATFTISVTGSIATIQLRNQDTDSYDIRVTARLLMR